MLPGENGEQIDLGRVGEVTDIDRDLLLMTCRADEIPVLPSVALDDEGGKLNVNADTAAAAVAHHLQVHCSCRVVAGVWVGERGQCSAGSLDLAMVGQPQPSVARRKGLLR